MTMVEEGPEQQKDPDFNTEHSAIQCLWPMDPMVLKIPVENRDDVLSLLQTWKEES